MLFGKYQFCYEMKEDVTLPPHKGSTLRGVFGRALKKVVCAVNLSSCEKCLLNANCMYQKIFELPFNKGLKIKNGPFRPCHPFVIEPPSDDRTVFRKGAHLCFHLLLFGEINHQLPYFVYAFKEMGRMGMGRAIHGKRASFDLLSVSCGSRVIYSGETGGLNMPESPGYIHFKASCAAAEGFCNIHVRLLTPLRLKHRNSLTAELPFHVLVRAALRRVSTLFSTFEGKEPDLNYKTLVHTAQSVSSDQENLQWLDIPRYSNRQRQGMQMGGLIGDISYSNVPAHFIPLLDFCKNVHLGKQTTFGLGKMVYEVL